MRRFLLLLALPAVLVAQAPDCHLARPAFDNPFSDRGGWYMPRYGWHVARAAGSGLLGEGLHRVTHLPRWASYLVAGVGIGVLPHVRGAVMHTYAFNLRDWSFDAFLSATPLLTLETWAESSWRTRVFGTTTIVTGYLAGACYAQP
jgi:hypothetical protein